MSNALVFVDPAVNSSSSTTEVTVLDGTKFVLQAAYNADLYTVAKLYGSSYAVTYSVVGGGTKGNIKQHRGSFNGTITDVTLSPPAILETETFNLGDICTVEIPEGTTYGDLVIRATYHGNPKVGSVATVDFTVHVANITASLSKGIELPDGAATVTDTATTSIGADTIVYSIVETTADSTIDSSSGVLTVGLFDEYLTVRAASTIVPELYKDCALHVSKFGTDYIPVVSTTQAATGINDISTGTREITRISDPDSSDDGTLVIIRTSDGYPGIAYFLGQFEDVDGEIKDLIRFDGNSQAVFIVEKNGLLSPPADEYKLICISRSQVTSAGSKF